MFYAFADIVVCMYVVEGGERATVVEWTLCSV